MTQLYSPEMDPIYFSSDHFTTSRRYRAFPADSWDQLPRCEHWRDGQWRENRNTTTRMIAYSLLHGAPPAALTTPAGREALDRLAALARVTNET